LQKRGLKRVIYKSQGIILEKATIDIANKDFSSGLSFVATSRVKTLHSIAFWKSFGWACLQKPITESMRMLGWATAYQGRAQQVLVGARVGAVSNYRLDLVLC
jgi:hypothetical protein